VRMDEQAKEEGISRSRYVERVLAKMGDLPSVALDLPDIADHLENVVKRIRAC